MGHGLDPGTHLAVGLMYTFWQLVSCTHRQYLCFGFEMDISFIFGDSRITNIQQHIDTANSENRPIYALKYSGKGLQELTTIAIDRTERHPHAKVIITGGICDFTERNSDHYNPQEKFLFNYNSVGALTSHMDNLFNESYQSFSSSRPFVSITYSELIGMDLEKIVSTKNPYPGQQDILNQAIMEINTKIVALNEKNSMPTPWISKRVHIVRKNGIHHHYERLFDGIHYDEALKCICARKFVETLYKMS